MKIGLSTPRSPDPEGLRRFAQRAEQLGFESVLAGDHIVLPTGGTTQYPYTATGAFSSPADEPFLETLTLLGYLVGTNLFDSLSKGCLGPYLIVF
jgi:alkanesulfonate monooxygenase SsuD/methylene tetrahydromethanopterin reductase-like flavin-dependent oxidoreductase (luciferase family)